VKVLAKGRRAVKHCQTFLNHLNLLVKVLAKGRRAVKHCQTFINHLNLLVKVLAKAEELSSIAKHL
jgi:exonuclease VII small subunit